MSFFPYQVDYAVSGKGKTFGATKKKVTFKFGVANRQALSNGQSGANCRGSEHEIQFIWSLQSGKRQIYADNKQVHYSESGKSGFTSDRSFSFQFGIPSPGSGSLRCALLALPVSNEAGGNKRPFDLRVNGISYFDMCKIYELGTPKMMAVPAASGYANANDYHNPVRDDELAASAEERRQIALAKAESLRELGEQRRYGGGASSSQQPMPQRNEEPNLIDFDSEPITAAAVLQPTVSGLTMDSTLQSSYSSFPQQQQQALPPAAPPQQQAYSNYTLSPVPEASFSGQTGYSSAGSGAPTQPPPPTQLAIPPMPSYPPAQQQQPWSAPPQPQWGQPAAPPQQQQPMYGGATPPAPQQQPPPPFASPASYGSAPSFAQPPRPPQEGQPPPAQQAPYGTTNPW